VTSSSWVESVNTDAPPTVASKRSALRNAARILVLASLVGQAVIIGYSGWEADPRLSCERLPYWGEWIDCLHGRSHDYVTNTEAAICVWLVAGVAMLFGRHLPAYISVLVPGVVCAGFVSWMAETWRASVMPYAVFGRPELWDILFAKFVGEAAIFVVCPVIAAWLLGWHARRERRAGGSLPSAARSST
jgi:hypothetical protein